MINSFPLEEFDYYWMEYKLYLSLNAPGRQKENVRENIIKKEEKGTEPFLLLVEHRLRPVFTFFDFHRR